MDSALASLLGVIVGASLSSIKDLVGFYLRRKTGRVYVASRITPMLNDFIARCALVAQDEGEEDEEGLISRSTTSPSLSFEGLDVDWRTLDAPLMRDLLELPYRILSADEAISVASEHSGPPDYAEYIEERRYQYALLGQHTSTLLQKLLAQGGLTEKPMGDWSPSEVISRALVEIEQLRNSRSQGCLTDL